MSAITFELPVTGLPDIPIRDGTPFRGFFKAGKMHVTVDADAENTARLPEPIDSGNAASRYIESIRGVMTMPTQTEFDADPRLEYLFKKHVMVIPSDEIFQEAR